VTKYQCWASHPHTEHAESDRNPTVQGVAWNLLRATSAAVNDSAFLIWEAQPSTIPTTTIRAPQCSVQCKSTHNSENGEAHTLPVQCKSTHNSENGEAYTLPPTPRWDYSRSATPTSKSNSSIMWSQSCPGGTPIPTKIPSEPRHCWAGIIS
jgi:hypothetical protein